MAKLTIYLIAIVFLCQSIAVFSQQDFDYFDPTGNVNGQQPPQQQTQSQAGSTTTTARPDFTRCLTACYARVTPQYNPVCGSNGQFYANRQRLECAQQCGLSVTFVHFGTCGPSAGGK